MASAWCQLELKRRDAAIAAFRQLLAAFPDHVTAPSATYHLARALVEGKRNEEAIALLRPFPERYRDSKLVPDARYLLGVASLGAGQTNEGVAELRAFVDAYPSHELANQARRTIVDRLVKEGRKDDLAEEYKTLMAQSPRTAESVYDAGFLATRLGRPRDAESAWATLRKEFPDHPLAARASYDLAQGAFGRGNFKDAAALAAGRREERRRGDPRPGPAPPGRERAEAQAAGPGAPGLPGRRGGGGHPGCRRALPCSCREWARAGGTGEAPGLAPLLRSGRRRRARQGATRLGQGAADRGGGAAQAGGHPAGAKAGQAAGETRSGKP